MMKIKRTKKIKLMEMMKMMEGLNDYLGCARQLWGDQHPVSFQFQVSCGDFPRPPLPLPTPLPHTPTHPHTPLPLST